MEWIERLNESINYIEEYLLQEIDYKELADITNCSTYHFQRMFRYVAGISVTEYIRRRKMSLAAVELQGGDNKVIDIALKYGYDSPTAFNRAFQSIHGIPPSALKVDGLSIKTFPPLRFNISIKGMEALDYRIEKKAAFRVVGVAMEIEKNISENAIKVPNMWQEAIHDGTTKQLASLLDDASTGLLGINMCNDDMPWKYVIGVATLKASPFEEFIIPSATWAIFSGHGVGQSIQELERRIFQEWLPTSGYTYANAPDIEVYFHPNPQNTKYEVWIPIRKSKEKYSEI